MLSCHSRCSSLHDDGWREKHSFITFRTLTINRTKQQQQSRQQRHDEQNHASSISSINNSHG